MAENNPSTHDKIAKRAENISMAAGFVSAAVSVGATIAAPTGLSAIAVAMGLTSAPLVVVAAPIVGVAASVAGVVSSGTYFYAKWKNRHNSGSS
jgi:hypothetical protein